MKIIRTRIPDVIVIEPTVFYDNRGFFFESFNKEEFNKFVGDSIEFVQDNHSKSSRGVLRGVHYQLPPYEQGKLVRCIDGEVFDVAVDIRESSPTFGKWVGEFLSADNKRQMWIPEGFAHGFVVISESAEFLYKTTNYYHPESEGGFLWDDHEVGIKWPDFDFILSNRDLNLPPFSLRKK